MRYSISSPETFLSLSISDMGFSADTAVTRFGPGKRNSYIIHFVTKGQGFFNGNPVKAGQGFLITPGLLEEYHCDPQDPWDFFWIISQHEAMQEIFPLFHAHPDTLIFDYDYIPQIKIVEESILIKRHNLWISQFEMLELFMSILKKQDSSAKDTGSHVNAQAYIDYAKRFIETNYAHPISVEEIAAAMGISVSYLFKLFKTDLNLSPKQYINTCRMHQAKILLKETNLSIGQIGCAVGYSDPLAFSRFFTVHEGVSPSGYRKH